MCLGVFVYVCMYAYDGRRPVAIVIRFNSCDANKQNRISRGELWPGSSPARDRFERKGHRRHAHHPGRGREWTPYTVEQRFHSVLGYGTIARHHREPIHDFCSPPAAPAVLAPRPSFTAVVLLSLDLAVFADGGGGAADDAPPPLLPGLL